MSPITLDYKPRSWQARVHKRLKRFNVVVLHRRAGKTELAIMELIDACLKCDLEMPLFGYLAPFRNQAKNIAWGRLKHRLRALIAAGLVTVLEGDLTVVFKHNGAELRLFGADNPDSMRGLRIDGIVIDEVAQVKPEVWQEVIQPALADREGWALFIGTPKGINLFSELYYRAQKQSDWHTALFTCHDTGSLPAREIERLRRNMSSEAFSRELLCDFTAAGVDQLISLIDAEDAARRVYALRDIAESPRVLGVDPARFGDDRSVIFPRQGLQAFEPIVMHGIDNMQLAARVADKIEEWKPQAVFIDAGNGAGVIDRLRQLGFEVNEVDFGGKAAKPKRFVNRRTEMWCTMAEWIVSGGSIPEEPSELRLELATPTYEFNAQQQRVLESKKDIKKRLAGSGSPDLGDGLALTFASPVHKKTPIQAARDRTRRSRARVDHNPYG